MDGHEVIGTKQKKVSRGAAVVFLFPSWSPDGERMMIPAY
jgi:hypothetical protein